MLTLLTFHRRSSVSVQKGEQGVALEAGVSDDRGTPLDDGLPRASSSDASLRTGASESCAYANPSFLYNPSSCTDAQGNTTTYPENVSFRQPVRA